MLLVWLSPSFPVGGFAYSHGLEAAVAKGIVTSRASLADWLNSLVEVGSIRTDVLLLAATWRREAADGELNDLALALQPSAERYLETAQQGTSFAATIAAAWPCDAIAALREAVDGDIAYPVAVGCAARGHAIAIRETARAFALAVVQNLVSAAIRLSVIGPTDGQRVVAELLEGVEQLARESERATLSDLGAAGFRADLAAIEHETLYSRLFRS
jgi:urease accessory protein